MNRAMRIGSALALGVSMSVFGAACTKQNPAPAPRPLRPPRPATSRPTTRRRSTPSARCWAATSANLNIAPAELELVKRGLADAATGKKPAVELEQYGPKIQAFAQSRAAAAGRGREGQGAGLPGRRGQGGRGGHHQLRPRLHEPEGGHGKEPERDRHGQGPLRGTLTDGTVFDSSLQRGQPVEFPLNGVIPCWTQGVAEDEGRREGASSPALPTSRTAIRARARSIPGATLIFEVELLNIEVVAQGASLGRAASARAVRKSPVKIHEYQGKAVLAALACRCRTARWPSPPRRPSRSARSWASPWW